MKKRFVLSVSYGDYRSSVGGTDKVILAHSKMFREAGVDYVFLFPLNLFLQKETLYLVLPVYSVFSWSSCT